MEFFGCTSSSASRMFFSHSLNTSSAFMNSRTDSSLFEICIKCVQLEADRISPESTEPIAAFAAEAKSAATCSGEWLLATDCRVLPLGVCARLAAGLHDTEVDEERDGEVEWEELHPLDLVRCRSASCQQKSSPSALPPFASC